MTEKISNGILNVIELDRPLLLVFWPLMGHDHSNISASLRDHGLTVTEELELVWYRKFANEQEESVFHSKPGVSERQADRSRLKDRAHVATFIGRR